MAEIYYLLGLMRGRSYDLTTNMSEVRPPTVVFPHNYRTTYNCFSLFRPKHYKNVEKIAMAKALAIFIRNP